MPIRDIDIEAIQVLDWMYDHGGPGTILSLNSYANPLNLTNQDAWTLGEYLNSRGLANIQFAYGLRVDAELTATGVAFVQRVRQQRRDHAVRNSSLRTTMLKWLYDHESREEKVGDWSALAEGNITHLGGRPYSANEIHKQAEYLYRRGLITSRTIDQVKDGCLEPRLTPDGEDCVTDHGGNVSEYRNQPATANVGNVYNITDNRGNIVAGGDGNSQTLSSGLDTAAVLKFAGTLAQSLPVLGLSEEEQADVKEQSDELHAEASAAQPNVGKMRGLLDSLLGVVGKAGTTAVGAIVAELGNEAVRAISGG